MMIMTTLPFFLLHLYLNLYLSLATCVGDCLGTIDGFFLTYKIRNVDNNLNYFGLGNCIDHIFIFDDNA